MVAATGWRPRGPDCCSTHGDLQPILDGDDLRRSNVSEVGIARSDGGFVLGIRNLVFTNLFAAWCVCLHHSFVSQYNGDQQPREIGPIVWQAIWIAVILCPILLLANPLAPYFFGLAGHEEAIRVEEVRYFQALNWGAGGMLISQAAQTFYSGRGKTLMVMIVDSFFAAMNVGLDYLWIFGHWGFPEAGSAGAGYATAVAMWLKALTYVLLLIRQKNRENFNTGDFRFDLKRWLRLWRFGGPSGLQMVLDVIGFTSFVVLIGRLGTNESAATSMAFSVSTLAFMPIWGFGMAAGILVGQHLGRTIPNWPSERLGIHLASA